MALSIQVNSVDKSNQIEWPSIKKMDVLTKEPDRLEFRIKNYGTKTYRPALNDDVKLYDGATLVFGGTIQEIHDSNDGYAKYIEVVCTDYQHTMDMKLVNKTYTSQTVAQIIDDFIANYLPAGFTDANVNGLSSFDKIVFNDEPPSKCLQRMAELLGDYDWYVDYNKDIHFFPEGSEAAPFSLDDTGGKYVFGSLKIENNINQLRNSIIIRGGDKESTTLTDTKIADGEQRTFIAKPSLRNLTIELDTGSGFNTLTIGQDGVDDPTTKDVLYNPNNGFIIFRSNNKPANTNKVRWSGIQVYPIKIIRRDIASIATYGEWQHIIRDATIKSESAAKTRAAAEIKKYANSAKEGIFRTYTSGLRSGMTINIGSTALGYTAADYKIIRTILTARSKDAFEYEVHILASEDVGILDVLGKLLVSDPATQFETLENEVIVQAEAWEETATMADSFTTTKYPRATPTYTETSTFTQTNNNVNPFGLNVLPIWVVGPYFYTNPTTDKKRVIRLDSSHKLVA